MITMRVMGLVSRAGSMFRPPLSLLAADLSGTGSDGRPRDHSLGWPGWASTPRTGRTWTRRRCCSAAPPLPSSAPAGSVGGGSRSGPRSSAGRVRWPPWCRPTTTGRARRLWRSSSRSTTSPRPTSGRWTPGRAPTTGCTARCGCGCTPWPGTRWPTPTRWTPSRAGCPRRATWGRSPTRLRPPVRRPTTSRPSGGATAGPFPTRTRSQHGGHAPTDVEHLTVDERRRRAGEEDEGAHQFLDPPPSTGRGAPTHPGAEPLVGDEGRRQLGLEVPGPDGVDADPAPGEVGAHALGEHLHCTLGCCVGGDPRTRDLALQGRDVDDPAAPARHHPPRDLPADEEGAGEVGVHHPTPGVVRHLRERSPRLHAGVVHQDVERPDVRLDPRDRCSG